MRRRVLFLFAALAARALGHALVATCQIVKSDEELTPIGANGTSAALVQLW